MCKRIYLILTLLIFIGRFAQVYSQQSIETLLQHPPQSARPWVFWYWMHGAVSKEGITADLEAMKSVGIGGAYLMPIKDTTSKVPFNNPVRQLSPEWWAMVHHAMSEAKRLNLLIGMHVSDGFALAGGPWITPEMSMQKLVWTKTYVTHSEQQPIIDLQKPAAFKDYYEDVAVYAYPTNGKLPVGKQQELPEVKASNGLPAAFLADVAANETFRSDTACWIQYSYPTAITCRSIKVRTGGNTYQALRLIVEKSDDGVHFKRVTKLEAPRHGWQDADEDYTYSIAATTAKHFRFVYDKDGSEPGAEDLDAAKWKPSLKVKGIYLGDEPVIHQYESKNGSVWRISRVTTGEQVPAIAAVPLSRIVNLTGKLDSNGRLNWTVPEGDWVIVRIGHTSTGHTNYTGGGALGLECDKFNQAAVKLQFNNWFGKAFAQDTTLARQVLKVFHVDSWECGSQNWSSTFPREFSKRRGYDLMPYLLVMTGVPVQDAATSEKVLHDVRQTIAELVNDVFYTTLKEEAHALGCSVSAEAIAPTMVSDGLMHYQHADLPMGEFWLNSPTHDKPNDMLDAISGAHIYGKRIIQAESFTSVRMNWAEHPGNLKMIGDRNFALGINKMVFHVFAHNPWMDKKPGMTLDGVGLYFQRDQTWFKQGKAWMDYITRCQTLLQLGEPVVDVAVFTGEEVPRRSILPDRLVGTLPGIFGKEKVEAERVRLKNAGQPLRQIPDGVTHSANMADPEDWIDPMNGYAYDSFNPDVLMRMEWKNGRVVLPGGASYAVLVIPGKHPLNPNGVLSADVQKKLKQLAESGARIVIDEEWVKRIGKGKNVVAAPFHENSFVKLGLQQDVDVIKGRSKVAWTHRHSTGTDIYFISNQVDSLQEIALSFRIHDKMLTIIDPVTGMKVNSHEVESKGGRTHVKQQLQPGQSLFYVFSGTGSTVAQSELAPLRGKSVSMAERPWTVQFDPKLGGPTNTVEMQVLKSWHSFADSAIRFYSGTASYQNVFGWNGVQAKTVLLQLDELYNIATVKVNGVDCGTIWTKPYQVDITNALKPGSNQIEILVANTWHNRLIGDAALPLQQRVTFTTAPFRLQGKPLQPAGLVGQVKLLIQ